MENPTDSAHASSSDSSPNTYILVSIAMAVLALVLMTGGLASLYVRRRKKIASKCISRASKEGVSPCSKKTNQECDVPSLPHLPKLNRLSRPSSISQAVTEAYRTTKLLELEEKYGKNKDSSDAQQIKHFGCPQTPPNLIDKPDALAQRPRWSRWFMNQTRAESTLSVTPPVSPCHMSLDETANGNCRALSLSRFPIPPTHALTEDVAVQPLFPTIQSPSSKAVTPMYSSANSKVSISQQDSSNTGEPPLCLLASPPPSLRGPRTRRSQNPDNPMAAQSFQSKPRVVSNDSSWQHRSMLVEISELPTYNRVLPTPLESCIKSNDRLISHSKSILQTDFRNSFPALRAV